jgi:HEPN domain-containing protein
MEKSGMNKSVAKEWLQKAWHDISSARILFEANHFTDTIGVDLHYSIEKILKSFLAYENKKIERTHELFKIYELVKSYLKLDNHEIKLLVIATKYHITEAYPSFGRQMPSRNEIKEILEFTEGLFDRVCSILDIEKSDVMK